MKQTLVPFWIRRFRNTERLQVNLYVLTNFENEDEHWKYIWKNPFSSFHTVKEAGGESIHLQQVEKTIFQENT